MIDPGVPFIGPAFATGSDGRPAVPIMKGTSPVQTAFREPAAYWARSAPSIPRFAASLRQAQTPRSPEARG
jgi:hypothetical protein